jgi:hypothetical protein
MRARLTQWLVSGRALDALPAFALAVWVGTIGGSAIGTDPSPNVTPPAANRILRITPKRGAVFPMGQLNQANPPNITILFGVVAASSITVQIWYFDDAQAVWIPWLAPIVRTPTGAATNVATANFSGLGSKVFVQVTANTLVQAMGYDVT